MALLDNRLARALSAFAVRLRHAMTVVAAAALLALLLDAVVETWQSQSAARMWVAAPIGLYLAFMAWLFRQERSRPPAAQQIRLSAFVLLAAIALSATAEGGLDTGVRLVSLRTRVILSGATAGVVAMAVLSVVQSPLPIAAKLVAAAAGAYGVVAFAHGIANGTGYARLLQGGADWQRLPYWLQGTVVGALGVVPLALVIEVGVAMARLKVRGRLFRIVVFALGVMLAQAGVTAPLKAAPSPGRIQNSRTQNRQGSEAPKGPKTDSRAVRELPSVVTTPALEDV